MFFQETEIASLSSKLTESNEKYSALKKKVRQYQAHCKSKELKYTERIRVAEEEYKQKLTSLRDKMEEGYASKGMRVRTICSINICPNFEQNSYRITIVKQSGHCITTTYLLILNNLRLRGFI